MRIVGNNPQLSRQTQGTASGAITGGKPVVVNTDGTVGSITSSNAITVYNAAATGPQSVATNGSGTVVIAYRDEGNSNKGTAIVGTISGGNITFGSEVIFESGEIGVSSSSTVNVVYDVANAKFVIFYTESTNNNYPTAIVGNVSGTSISFGTAVVIDSNISVDIVGSYDSTAEKIVVPFYGFSNALTHAVVGTVSGTSISFGGRTQISSKRPADLCAVYDSNADKTVVLFRDDADTKDAFAVVCTVSGTSISAGSDTNFSSSIDATQIGMDFDSSANKVVIAYVVNQSGHSDLLAGKAVVGTVSGTSISFGSTTTFVVGIGSGSVYAGTTTVSYDSTNNKSIIFYDESDANLKRVVGTVSGTSISFDTSVLLLSGNKGYIKSDYDSTNDTAIVVSRDYGNSSHGTAVLAGSGTFSATSTNLTSENFIGFAEDTVATGQPVTINTKGAIADNMPQVAASATLGTEVLFHNSDNNDQASIFIPDTNKILIAYKDEGNSSYGTVRVATIDPSDNSVSYGSEIVFNSGQTSLTVATYDTNSDRIVIGYANSNVSRTGKAIVGTVSGSSVSFGTAVTFNDKIDKLGVTFDSNSNKVVFGYEDANNSGHGTAIVGTVDSSDNSISFGSEAVYKAADTSNIGMCFDSNSNKVIIAYRHNADSSKGEAIVGTISGTSISYGSATVFNSVNTQTFDKSVVFDSSNNKVVIIYKDSGSGNTEALVGTVSGTSISFGSLATVGDSDGGAMSATFDSDNNNIILAYQDDGDDGNISIGTVSGTDISFNTPVEFASSAAITPMSIAYDPNTKRALITFTDYDNSSNGFGIVYSPAGDVDLTPAQTYFVQTDGTLSETADDPSVTAGTAVAGSTLIVKG